MKYLLDTGVLLHSLIAKPRLSQRALRLLEDDSSDLYFSSASSWEIGIKSSIGKLSLPASPREFVSKAIQFMALEILDITHGHALDAGELPPHHRDPFDRMLIAQARAEGLVLLTTDSIFEKYEVEIVHCGE